MQFEVEQKYPVADLAVVEKQLIEMGAEIGPVKVEVDTYFAHPCRNFAETDEALRIRRIGDVHFMTYKGPKMDKTTKTRPELDLPLPSDPEVASRWPRMLHALGFTPVAEVCKERRKASVTVQGEEVEVCLDHIASVGEFVELEWITEDESHVQAGKTLLASLAETLGLSENERRSYLELLLIARGEA